MTPIDDLIEHEQSEDCVCGPDVEYVHPETGVTYENGPLYIHHALDERE